MIFYFMLWSEIEDHHSSEISKMLQNLLYFWNAREPNVCSFPPHTNNVEIAICIKIEKKVSTNSKLRTLEQCCALLT